MGFVFIICIVVMYVISILDNKRGIVPKGLIVDRAMFKPNRGFAVGALFVLGILAALYTIFW